MFTKTCLVATALVLVLATTVDAATRVSSFRVCSDAWTYVGPGVSTDIYQCSGDNIPDFAKRVGTYSFLAGPEAASNGNGLILVTDQFEINGCILQRIGTFDAGPADEYTDSGIWTTSGNNACPKASNIDPQLVYELAGVGSDIQEMFTFMLYKPVPRTPLTPAPGGK